MPEKETIMKPSNRLEHALSKLYTAFHNNQLHPECCTKCAVGTILDQRDSWKHLSDAHGALQLNYVGKVHQSFGRRFNGYTPLELLQIEATFLKGCGYTIPLKHKKSKPNNPKEKDNLFNGLTEVVALLCKLDKVDNVMDCSKLFAFENNKPLSNLSAIIG
jgi:hypothetical protein